MVAYDAFGYDDIRAYVENQWNWLALVDDAGTEILRWDLTANTNVTQDSGSAANPLQYTVNVTGNDIENAGFTLPVTLTTIKLYRTSSETTPVGDDSIRDSSGSTMNATFEASEDEMNLTFTQRWPP